MRLYFTCQWAARPQEEKNVCRQRLARYQGVIKSLVMRGPTYLSAIGLLTVWEQGATRSPALRDLPGPGLELDPETL